ncbi:hypothetical protein A3F37_01850 [Candidatus Saccharibacteria bacterium RIFCSPHIGHO2_12_FULL_41_12]|nr:MAG: hypothetical protein A3F37_01850 [Candidatus Saccharibacteria bacterium RIFCSPHIGHO2_12_FULL_41_12]
MAEKKNTIYLDIDEDITELVGKVQASNQGIIALVLPKRAPVMQSIVNVRLLSRAAKQNDKNIVLITSDPTVISHAGEVELFVAENLTSKPYLPEKPTPAVEPMADDEEELEIDQVLPVAGVAVAVAAKNMKNAKSAKGAKKSKIKIPDFGKFRTLLIAGGIALVLLIIFGVWAIFFAGSASVAIKTNTTEKTANVNIKLDTKLDEVNVDTMTVPAKNEELRVTDTGKAPATGTKDKGAKASGNVTLKNCGPNSATIPAGTGISNGSSTYISQQSVSLGDGNFDGGGNCKNSGSHVSTVAVVAQSNGEQFNSGPRSYTVAGFSNVSGQGDSMTGGSSQVVKVISQADVDSAKAKVTEKQKTAKDDLIKTLTKGDYLPIEESFTSKESGVQIAPAVGSEAAEVSVTMTITSSMMGVKEADLKKIVDKQYEQELKDAGANISDYGFGQARFTPDKDNTNVAVQTTISIGPKLDENEIKSLVAGKKAGQAEDILKKKEGVVEAQVKVKPFWKTKVPKKDKKIKVTIEKK